MKENWERKHIADICDKASSNIAQNKLEGLNGDYPVYGASGYVQNVDFYHRDKAYIGVVKDGSGVGRVNVYPAYSSLLGTMQYILPKEGFSLQFVAYALKSLNLASFASGAAIPHIYFKDYGQCEILVPPTKEEQEQVVAELDLLSGIIDKLKAELRELDNLAQSTFYDMFGDPIENPKGWEVKNLGAVCDFKNGLNFAPDKTGETYYLIGVSDFQAKSRLECDESLKTIELDKPLSEEYLLVDDDILFVRSNGNKALIARNVLVTTKGLNVTYSGFCIRARVKRVDVLPFFLNSLLKLPSAHNALTASGRGCNIANLSQKTLDGFQLILPPLSLQQEFADKIASIEKQKAALTQSIAESQKLLDYTMDKYFG